MSCECRVILVDDLIEQSLFGPVTLVATSAPPGWPSSPPCGAWSASLRYCVSKKSTPVWGRTRDWAQSSAPSCRWAWISRLPYRAVRWADAPAFQTAHPFPDDPSPHRPRHSRQGQATAAAPFADSQTEELNFLQRILTRALTPAAWHLIKWFSPPGAALTTSGNQIDYHTAGTCFVD